MINIDDKIFIIENFISLNSAKFLVDNFSIDLKPTQHEGIFTSVGSGEGSAHKLSGNFKVDKYDGKNDIAVDLLTGICTNMEKTMSLIFDKHIIIKSVFYSHMKTGGKNPMHIDNQEERYKNDFSGLLYLTDTYEGGNLYFPYKDLKFKPKPGTFITFIGTDDLAHEVQEVITGDRVNLVCFFLENNQVSNI